MPTYHFGMASMQFGGVEIGCLQNVSIDMNYDTAMLYCGNSLYAADVRTHSGSISGSAEFADINAVAMQKVLGGTRTYDSIEITSTSFPSSFQLVVSHTTDSVTMTFTFKAARSNQFAIAWARDQHTIPNFQFDCYADASGSVATIDLGVVS